MTSLIKRQKKGIRRMSQKRYILKHMIDLLNTKAVLKTIDVETPFEKGGGPDDVFAVGRNVCSSMSPSFLTLC